MAMMARDLMTPNPVTVTRRATIRDAWELMREAEVRHLPVVDNGALVGMVSDRDFARLGLTLTAEDADPSTRRNTTSVGQVMSADVVAIEPETEIDEIIELLLEHKIGALPVLDRSTDKVVGILSYIDVLRALRDRLEGE
jgi:acetoin utilization protein AcuB